MKQVLQNLRSGETSLVDVPAPGAAPGTLLIATRASLISIGTERMLVDFGRASYLQKARQQPEKVRQVLDKVRTDGLFATYESIQAKLDTPLELGYCNAGVVVDVGRGVDGYRVGDRVASNGSHAEIVRVPMHLCARIPDGLPFDHACYTVAGAIALQGVRLAEPTLGERFLVIGLGLIGQLLVQILEANGARVLAIDLDGEKCDLAKPFCTSVARAGDDPGLLQAAVDRFTAGAGMDGVIIAASTRSSAPMNHAATVTRKRGRIVQVGATGLELDRTPFFKKEIRFQVSCSYGPGRYDPVYERANVEFPLPYVRWTEQRNLEAVLDLLAGGKLRVAHLTTHRFPIDRATSAYEVVSADRRALGIVLDYPTADSPPVPATALGRTITIPGTVSTPPTGKAVVGVVGAGSFAARFLVPNLRRTGAKLKTIASSGGVSASHCARKFGFGGASTDPAAVLGDDEITALVVATRHDTHARFVIDGLRAAKAVFVEKPLCLTAEELTEIDAAYRACAAPLLMVGYNRRFAPLVVEAKKRLDPIREPKAIVITVNAGVLPADHWHLDPREGGGRLLAEGCHFVDLLRFLVGHPAERLEAVQMGGLSQDVSSDTMSLTIRFQDGSLGTLHYLGNGPASFPKERIEAFVAGRALRIDNFRVLRGFGWPGLRTIRCWRQDKGHQAAMARFINAVEGTEAAPIPYGELVEGMELCLHAREIASRRAAVATRY